jgi:hypothetical protein
MLGRTEKHPAGAAGRTLETGPSFCHARTTHQPRSLPLRQACGRHRISTWNRQARNRPAGQDHQCKQQRVKVADDFHYWLGCDPSHGKKP